MAINLKANERLVCVGQTALRAPDGMPLPAVPMYVIVKEQDIDPKSRLSTSEIDLHSDIASELALLFKKYVDGVEKLSEEA